MPLAPGSTLAHYAILAPLGAGAMGEVYRARDGKLNREVAIKVLPEHFAADAERLRRFEREAQTLASLNHPHVAQIYGVDQVGDTCFLVLELVEGETLEDRLRRGALPLDEALDVCGQIAEGLEAAHEAGVIHRDLKPANVRLTPDGRVKVLDFGLAKPARESGDPASAADSVLSTEHGRLLGTPTYMAPEQARGKSIDRRVDIWAFGCVLYECLTSKRAFVGETLTDVLGAVLHTQADLSALPPSTPRRVRELLESCFAKDPRSRLRDIGQARLELARAANDPPAGAASVADAANAAGTAGARAHRPPWRSPAVLLSAVLLVAALVLTITALAFRPSPGAPGAPGSERPVVRATLAFPAGLVMSGSDRSVAVSPDGTLVAVVLGREDRTAPGSLYLRDLSRLEFRALPGTEEASYPFWSPDGRSLAFFAGRQLRRIDLADGIVRKICAAPAGRGGSWGSQGTIVFAPSAVGGLSIVNESGGDATPITEPATPAESHRVPHMLPDGERFLYYGMNAEKLGVYAFDPASRQSHLVVAGAAEAMFVEPSSLVFARDENLVVQPFDLARLELTGSPRPIAAGVNWDTARAALNVGLSSRGTLVYQPVARAGTSKLAWMDRQGVRTPLPVQPAAFEAGAVSPDGRRAAVNIRGNRREPYLSVLDLERGVETRLGEPGAPFYYGAIWTREGQRVIASDANVATQCLVSFAFGGGAATRLLEGESGYEYGATSITPDGRTLLFAKVPMRDKVGDIMTLPLAEGGTSSPFMTTAEAEWSPLISPSGEAVAYSASNEDDPGGLLKIVAYPQPSAPVLVSPTRVTGQWGWLSAGELYWRDLSLKVWSATVTSQGGQLDVGAPSPMFDGLPLDDDVAILAWDLPRERFLIAIEDSAPEQPQLVIVSDWRPQAADAQPAQK